MRAKRINEYGGAGFSYGGGSSIFPVNRGGQMNRGGFGGAANLGGPNMMYTYEIKPLNRTLQPKQNLGLFLSSNHFFVSSFILLEKYRLYINVVFLEKL